jgi:hypothetical protein
VKSQVIASWHYPQRAANPAIQVVIRGPKRPHCLPAFAQNPHEQDPLLQKNGGPAEIILHFFSHLPCFVGFLPLQAPDFTRHALIRPLQKKSRLKTYRRFFVRPAMCHNRRMNGRIVQWEMGREKPAAQRQDRIRRLERTAIQPAGLLQFSPAQLQSVQVSTSEYE